jgi:hypothetical protein
MNQLEDLVRLHLSEAASDFRPCAFFDDRLDCIRVIARDCSVLEERINDRLTVFVDNYYPKPGRSQYVGFTIKGARHFCNAHGLNLSASIKMTQVIDALMANSPTLIVEWFVELVVKPLVEQGKIEQVEIPNLSATPSPEPA